MENYKLIDSILKMNPGDIFEPSDKSPCIKMCDDGSFCLSEHGGALVMMSKQYLELDGKIIPAKKEMVSAEEWISERRETGNNLQWKVDDVRAAFEASEQNRDILYADLMGIIDETDTGLQNVSDQIRAMKRESARILSILKPN